mmetsp:Transcript_42115/g.91775  ORF Transcript_42115/g.91775 Transcript_42115/m.91775 type:complete len:357 (+) Transcript_42115:42-1112(+)
MADQDDDDFYGASFFAGKPKAQPKPMPVNRVYSLYMPSAQAQPVVADQKENTGVQQQQLNTSHPIVAPESAPRQGAAPAERERSNAAPVARPASRPAPQQVQRGPEMAGKGVGAPVNTRAPVPQPGFPRAGAVAEQRPRPPAGGQVAAGPGCSNGARLVPSKSAEGTTANLPFKPSPRTGLPMWDDVSPQHEPSPARAPEPAAPVASPEFPAHRAPEPRVPGRPAGLQVEVVSARDLRDVKLMFKMKPFVSVLLGEPAMKKFCHTVAGTGRNPEWQGMTNRFSYQGEQRLTFQVLHKSGKGVGSDALIGEVQVSLQVDNFQMGTPWMSRELQLVFRNPRGQPKPAGFLKVKLSWVD